MSVLNQILASKAPVIPIAAWLVAQALKTIIQAIRKKTLIYVIWLVRGECPVPTQPWFVP
jgi:acid phosphatase family membrane protein YuiD